MPRSSASPPDVHPLPRRALVISLVALAVALIGTIFFPESLADFSFISWLLALAPAVLLSVYRGWKKVVTLLAVGMVLLALGGALDLSLELGLGQWPGFTFVLAAYVGIALGFGWMGDVRSAMDELGQADRERSQARDELRLSHADLKLAQWKLIEVEKFEAVGQLAAGVAHEVKNPLMTILTGVRFLKLHLKDADQDVRMLLEDMRDAVARADAVITGLLDFSAPHALDAVPTDLADLVVRSGRMVKHEIDQAQLTLCEEVDGGLPLLSLDRQRIQQVLVNLLTNAAHATPPGGSITVRAYLLPHGGDESAADSHGGTGEGLVALEIDDTGTGIPEQNLTKLFNPFFTTKPTGKGTGLGLAVTRQIIEMHGATIRIQNRDEGGARVTIVFPVTEGSPHGQETHPAG